MEKHLAALTEELKKILGEKLLSVTLYGSAARNGLSGSSDINLLVILDQVTLETLSSVGGVIKKAQSKAKIAPVFWGRAELESSADVFPLEFGDMIQHHKVLFGADPFDKISVDTRNLRHQLEFELRSKILRIRGEWFHAKGSKSDLLEILARAGTSLLYLFENARTIAPGNLSDEVAEPFKTCVRLKKKEVTLGTDELEKLYGDVHESASRITAVINAL